MSHVSEIDETRAHFMHDISSDLLVDVSSLMFNLILEALLDISSRSSLPFGLLIIEFLACHQIVSKPHETRLPIWGKLTKLLASSKIYPMKYNCISLRSNLQPSSYLKLTSIAKELEGVKS